LLAVGLHSTGYDLDLRQYGDGHWRASFRDSIRTEALRPNKASNSFQGGCTGYHGVTR
jgi:hypothetical protein